MITSYVMKNPMKISRGIFKTIPIIGKRMIILNDRCKQFSCVKTIESKKLCYPRRDVACNVSTKTNDPAVFLTKTAKIIG